MLNITFSINYNTVFGQRLIVIGSIPALGNWNVKDGLLLSYHEGGNWEDKMPLPSSIPSFEYRYAVVNDNFEELNKEHGEIRVFQVSNKTQTNILLRDAWRTLHHSEYGLYNSAFLNLIFKPDNEVKLSKRSNSYEKSLHFQIQFPRIESGQQLCVLGNIPELGSWNPSKPFLLNAGNFPLWSGVIPFTNEVDIEYKYGVYDLELKTVLFLEHGASRKIAHSYFSEKDCVIITDAFFNHPNGNWKGAGFAVPVFSLRTKKSFGVGEFLDIKLLVDWAKKIGMKMVQILPVNDTSAKKNWEDSYPYAAISVFALHTQYLHLEAIEGFEKAVDKKAYTKKQKQLNSLEKIDYEEVMNWKLQLARQIFDQQKAIFLNNKAFKAYFEANQHWLKSYALFCALRDKYQTVEFNKWGTDSQFSEAKLEKATNEKNADFDQIAFYYFLQYYLDKQLQEATQYARANGVVLKGDIPIGIYRDSVDAWTQPHLYNMDGQAGAPPDPFSDLGQNWGFPTYNWAEMEKDGFQWWQNRLKSLSKYFDAFRIDHILGFFRIWQIPLSYVEGICGFFNPAIPVTIEEFAKRGIPFDYERFCEPYITESIVNQLFGEDANWVFNTLLEKKKNGDYRFKPEFDTQRKVEAYFKQEKNLAKASLQTQIFKLHANILFIEQLGSNKKEFHPRIRIPNQDTTSFLSLPYHIQHLLNELSHDYFNVRQTEFWRKSAMSKLPTIRKATDMLICGEDLGMIPACVPGVMQDLDLLTLEIQRMSKNPNTEFLQSQDIPYFSVCSPGTHDMSPIRAWWLESEKAQIQRFYNNELKLYGEAPAECSSELVEKIISQQLRWPGMWTVFPMQDLLALSEDLKFPDPMEERINIPAIAKHYWRYRLHIGLEELIGEKGFNEKIRGMLGEVGR